MDQSKQQNNTSQPGSDKHQELYIDPKTLDNAVLSRLLVEIDFEKETRIHAYNRTHNRHNRGR